MRSQWLLLRHRRVMVRLGLLQVCQPSMQAVLFWLELLNTCGVQSCCYPCRHHVVQGLVSAMCI